MRKWPGTITRCSNLPVRYRYPYRSTRRSDGARSRLSGKIANRRVRLEDQLFRDHLIGAMFLSKRYGFDLPVYVKRFLQTFGNLLSTGGTFVPGLLAEDRYWTALSKLIGKARYFRGEEC